MTRDGNQHEVPQEHVLLPIVEFAFPHGLRDRLVAAVGEKLHMCNYPGAACQNTLDRYGSVSIGRRRTAASSASRPPTKPPPS